MPAVRLLKSSYLNHSGLCLRFIHHKTTIVDDIYLRPGNGQIVYPEIFYILKASHKVSLDAKYKYTNASFYMALPWFYSEQRQARAVKPLPPFFVWDSVGVS